MNEMIEMMREILSSAYNMGRGDGVLDAQGNNPQYRHGDDYANDIINEFRKQRPDLIEQLANLLR